MRSRPFIVGEWQVFPLEGRIVREGRAVRLRPKAMDVLCLLASVPGEVVERDRILGEVWGRTAVTDEPLTATVGELRRVLGDRRQVPRYIETIPKRGYRLIAEVADVADIASTPRPSGAPDTDRSAVAEREEESAGPARSRLTGLAVAGVAVAVMGVTAAMSFLRIGDDGAAAAPRSIAVLPFAIQGDGERDAYFGDGLAQEILSTLTTVEDLRVVARHSAFAFRDQRHDLAAIREALDVDVVLDGTIRRERDRVRVNVQLVDVANGYNLWAETYDRRLGDTFLLQTEIARAIADRLRVTLGGGTPMVGARAPAEGAYIDYLQGRYLFETARDEAGLRDAIRYLEEAIAADADFAPAYAALAGAWARLSDTGAVLAGEGYENVRRYARRAVDLSPDLADGHLFLGWASLYHDWDWTEARRRLERALELAPGDRFILTGNAALNFHLGQFDRAIHLAEMVTAREPLRATPHYNLAYFSFTAGDLEAAERSLARAEELVPGYPRAGLLRVQIDLARGDVARAESRVETNAVLAHVAEALIAKARGDEERGFEAVARLERDFADTAAYQIAEVYAWLGEIDEAFRWLERAWELRDPGMTDIKVDPLLEPLRSEPRYRELLARMGFDSLSVQRGL